MPRTLLLALLLLASLRPAAAWAEAPPADSLAQRLAACGGCHGEQGRASREGYYPRIAGKPAGYLYRQLLNFRDGVRHNAVMQQMLEYLPDIYLHEIAEGFAAGNPQYPPPPAAGVAPGILQRGEALALHGDPARDIPACAACHGENLMGVQPDIPGLLGLPRDYLAAQLGAWKTGTRRMVVPDCMAQVVERLGPGDPAAVSAWLSLQPVDSQARPAAAPSQRRPLRCGAAP